MKKILFAAVVALSSIVVWADVAATEQAPKRPRAGFALKPGSQKGTFTFINTQSALDRKEIEAVAKIVADELLIKVVVVDKSYADPASLVKGSEGPLGVVIVADDSTPTMLVAPEDGWGVVNVKKLDKFNTPEGRAKFYAKRCRGEILRAFSAVSGGIASSYPGNVMSAVKIEDIEIAPEGLPQDKIIAAQRFLKSRGYSPWTRAPYAKACKEGWAPAPTNDAQKVIWEQYHSKPTEPMRIKFDPKQGE